MKPIDIMKAINDLDDSYLIEHEMRPKRMLKIQTSAIMLTIAILIVVISASIMALAVKF